MFTTNHKGLLLSYITLHYIEFVSSWCRACSGCGKSNRVWSFEKCYIVWRQQCTYLENSCLLLSKPMDQPL